MSTVFFAENAPQVKVPNEYFMEDQPEDELENPREVMVSAWPEVEVSSLNIKAFGQLIQVELESELGTVGSLVPSDLHSLMRRLIVLGASEKQRKQMLRPDRQEGNFFAKGVDDDRVYGYVSRLMEVVSYCLEHNKRLMWA